MNTVVSTFGGAVTWLKDNFGTFDILSKKTEILEHIKKNPDDKETQVAFGIFLTVINKIENEPTTKRYIWYATDTFTGKKYQATSSIKLGKLIGVSKDMVILTFNRDGLTKGRFKIDRKEFTPENENVWIAKNQETSDVIKAKTAKELAKKINVSESAIVTCRSQKKLVRKKYRIFCEKNKKAQ